MRLWTRATISVAPLATLAIGAAALAADVGRTQTAERAGASADSLDADLAIARELAAEAEVGAALLDAIRTHELLIEIEDNDGFTDATRDVLFRQVQSGFSEFAKSDDELQALAVQDRALKPIDPSDVPIEGSSDDLEASPFQFDGVLVYDTLNNSPTWRGCYGAASCDFPDLFDAKVELVFLVWAVTPAALTAIDAYVDEHSGKSLRLVVGGHSLTRGTGPSDPEDFFAFTTPFGCGPTQQLSCLYSVVARDAWYPQAPPWPTWNIQVQLWDTQQLNVPIVDFDAWGNPIWITSVPVQSLARSVSVLPPSTLGSYWLSTIGSSVMSPRCTSCHALDTQEKLSAQHNGKEGPIIPIPSNLVSGESVNHCDNCHEAAFSYLGASSPFPENEWATPTPELDIDFAEIINDHPNTWPTEICGRMKLHLPTHSQRQQHFHEDARLFWAVEKGEIPLGEPSRPTAAPHSYAEFIRRFDVWNDSGAVCP